MRRLLSTMASSSSVVLSNGVQKSLSDKCTYKAVTLANGLRALVVCDPAATDGAACLSVGVGHLSDPDNIAGMAHFCEHMLFLGSEKFPQATEYKAYIKHNGGTGNASTAAELTQYHFRVTADALGGALDRFSQFFVAPLMDPSCVDREVRAVDSEHSKNLFSDGRRIFMLNKLSCKPGHVMRKFGTGNVETLRDRPAAEGIAIRDALLEWYQAHYCASIMRLCVVGPQSVDELEHAVVSNFSAVPNRGLSRPVFDGERFTPAELGTLLWVKAVRQMRQVKVSWPIWAVEQPDVEHVSNMWGHIVGHEGPGSLLSVLKAKGLASQLSAGTSTAEHWRDLVVSVSLTPDGLVRWREVVETVFAYASLLEQDTTHLEWLYDELRHMRDAQFRFKSPHPPMSVAVNTSRALHHYDATEVLAATHLFAGTDTAAILGSLRRMAAAMRPENSRILLCSHEGEPAENATDVEPIYSTPHAWQPTPDDVAATWQAARRLVAVDRRLPEPFSGLALPSENPYVATDFTVAHEVRAEATAPAAADPFAVLAARPTPALVQSTPASRLWFTPDVVFGQPRGIVCAHVLLPGAMCVDPRRKILKSLALSCVSHDTVEATYDASIAGLSVQWHSTSRGYSIKVSGFSHKLPLFVERVVQLTATHMPSEAAFNRRKDAVARGLENVSFAQPHVHAREDFRLGIRPESGHFMDDLATVKAATYDDMVSALASLRAEPNFIDVYTHGNFTADDAAHLGATVMRGLSTEAVLPPDEWANPGVVDLPLGVHLQSDTTHPNPGEKNSAIRMAFLLGDDSPAQQALGALFKAVLGEPAFSQLRTNEQLGYIVSFGMGLERQSVWAVLTVQSHVADVDVLEARCESFLDTVLAKLRAMDDATFQEKVDVLVKETLKPSSNVYSEAATHWESIQGLQFDFGARQKLASALKDVSRSQFVEHVEAVLCRGGLRRRVLSNRVRAAAPDDGLRRATDFVPVVAGVSADGTRNVAGLVRSASAPKPRIAAESEAGRAAVATPLVGSRHPVAVALSSAQQLRDVVPARIPGVVGLFEPPPVSKL